MKKFFSVVFNVFLAVPLFYLCDIFAIIGLGATIALIYLQDWTGWKIFPTHDGSDRLLIGAGLTSAGLGFIQSIIAVAAFYLEYPAAGFDLLIYPTVLAVIFVYLHDLFSESKS